MSFCSTLRSEPCQRSFFLHKMGKNTEVHNQTWREWESFKCSALNGMSQLNPSPHCSGNPIIKRCMYQRLQRRPRKQTHLSTAGLRHKWLLFRVLHQMWFWRRKEKQTGASSLTWMLSPIDKQLKMKIQSPPRESHSKRTTFKGCPHVQQ